MTHSPSDVVTQLLIDKGHGSTIDGTGTPGGAWPVYTDNEPTSPDNVVTVYLAGDGPNHGRTNPDGQMQGPESIQIRIRCKDYRTGYTKADSIRTFIESPSQGAYRQDVTIGAIRYTIHSFCKISNVIPLGKESPTSVRRVFVINCYVTVDQCG